MIESTTGIDVVLGGHNHIVLQPPKRVQRLLARTSTTATTEPATSELDDSTRRAPDADAPKQPARSSATARRATSSSRTRARSRSTSVGSTSSSRTTTRPRRRPGARDYDPVNGFEVADARLPALPGQRERARGSDRRRGARAVRAGRSTRSRTSTCSSATRSTARGASRRPAATRRSATSSPTAMWLRLGIQTDFSLTNTTGIRADLVPGPGHGRADVQHLPVRQLDHEDAALGRRGAGALRLRRAPLGRPRLRLAGADRRRARRHRLHEAEARARRRAGRRDQHLHRRRRRPEASHCASDERLSRQGAAGLGSCDVEARRLLAAHRSASAATSSRPRNYLAAGGSGFRVLQRNTTQFDTQVQQRDALIDYIRAGAPCGADDDGKLGRTALELQARTRDCAERRARASSAPAPRRSSRARRARPIRRRAAASSGACVLAQVPQRRRRVPARRPATTRPSDASKKQCEAALSPCASAGEQCKFLACVDRRLGNFSDGRLRMVGQ